MTSPPWQQCDRGDGRGARFSTDRGDSREYRERARTRRPASRQRRGNFTARCPLEEVTEDGWRATIEGNLTVTFLTLKSFLPGMKECRRGDINTISSSAGRRPHERAPIHYGAAKAGIALITQYVPPQAGPFGVRANCKAPETILTEDNLQRIPEAMRERMAASHPIARLGTPEDVARACAVPGVCESRMDHRRRPRRVRRRLDAMTRRP